MDFSLINEAFRRPFMVEKNGLVKALVIFAIGFLLALWPRVQVSGGVSVSLGDAVLYLCIYALPMGWGALAAGVSACLAGIICKDGAMCLAYLVIRLVAVMGGRVLYQCTATDGNRMALPAIWCLCSLLIGYFCYESVFFGVMTGSLAVLFHLAQWAACLVVGLGLISLFRRMGWELKPTDEEEAWN